MGNVSSRTKSVRSLVAIVSTVAVGLALSGCGTSGTETASNGKPSGEIRVLSNWSGSEGEAFQAMVDGFTKANPKVKVKVDSVPFDQTQTMLTQQFSAGNAPDVAVALPGMVRQLSDQGLLMNLDSMWDSWVKDGEYNDSLREMSKGTDGKTYSVYVKGNVNGLIWYNSAKTTAAGATVPPASWDDFTGMLDSYKATGKTPFSVGAKDVWVPTQWVDPILLNVAGVEKFNKLERGEIAWDDKDVVEAFTVLSSMMEKYWPTAALDTGFSDETCGWVTGDALFGNNGAFVNGIVPSCDSKLEAGKDFSFFTLPAYKGSEKPAQAVSGDFFIGAKDTKNPVATTAFLKYLGSVEAQTIWAKRGGYIAPNMKVPSSVYPTVNDQAAADLWPKDPKGTAGYDLDDYIGGEIQAKYRSALVDLIRNHDVSAFIKTMKAADTRSNG